MIELGQAGSELAGARTRRRHDDERTRSLDELVLAVALLAHDKVDIVGVALNGVMELAGNAEHGEAAAELVGGRLTGVLGEHDGTHEESVGTENVGKAQDILVVRDAKVTAGLVLLDMVGVDGDDDLNVIRQALKHAELAVGLETGQHAARMVVVEQLAAEFKVELAAELGDALLDVLGLVGNVLLVIETLAHAFGSFVIWRYRNIVAEFRSPARAARTLHAIAPTRTGPTAAKHKRPSRARKRKGAER